MDWDAMALVGRIARAHGIKGQVIVNPDTDFPEERFRPGATMFTTRGPVTLTSVRLQNGRPVIGIEGVETMSDAETLAGLELRVPVEELAPLPAGTFYHHEVIGCQGGTGGGGTVGTGESGGGALAGSRLVGAGAGGGKLVSRRNRIL